MLSRAGGSSGRGPLFRELLCPLDGRSPGEVGFWDACAVNRIYLFLGSAVLLISAVSDVQAFLSEGDLGQAAVVLVATAAFLGQWVRSTVGFAMLVVAGVLSGAIAVDPLTVSMVLPFLLAQVFATAQSRAFLFSALGFTALWVGLVPVLWDEAGMFWITLVFALAGLGVGATMRGSRLRQARDAARIRDAERRAREAAERERRILARDLHDIVAHNLTIISMQARTAQYVGSPEAAVDVLRVVGDSAQDALRDLRRMLAVLQQEGVVESGSVPGGGTTDDAVTVARLGEGAERMAEDLRLLGMEVSCDVDLGPEALNLGVRAALYRVMQEAVTNAAKHGGAGERAWLRASTTPEAVVLEVCNTVPAEGPGQGHGGGRVEENSSGVGLRSMRDRIEAFGGTLEVGPSEDGVWQVRATVPLSDM
ncbi:MAG: histidine kinase [Micrococcus sp.]|nr:histidine kinase [Micrococcus sp.]